MNSEKNHLIEKPIAGLIRQIAVPGSVGFFFNTLYNIVDTYFAGRISTEALAGVALSFPVFFIIIAIGSGISTGAAALISNSLGAGKKKTANFFAVQAAGFGAVLSIGLTILGLAVSPVLLGYLGAEGRYFDLSLGYVRVIFLGAVFFISSFTFNAALNARGDTKTFRNLLVFGFFANLVLDPWFIYGGLGVPALGVAGVAWATVLIQFLTCLFLFFKLLREGIFGADFFRQLLPRKKYYLEISKQGFPASLNMAMVAIGIFVITFFVSRFGQEAVAAYGIATRFDQLALLPVVGINIATLTLVGQNNGAGMFSRVKETISLAMRYALMVTAAGATLVFLTSPFLINIFSDDPDVILFGSRYLRISAGVYFAYTILFISISALQGLKKPFYAVWIGIFRQILAPLPVFWLLAYFFDLGISGIWWGIFLVNWSAAIATLFYLKKTILKAEKKL